MKFPVQLHSHLAPRASAWWLWAGLMVLTTSRATSITSLVALAISAILIAYRYRISQQHWKTFVSLIKFASYLVIARIVLQIVFGAPFGSDILFRLPSVELPNWFTGVRIGGAVTLQSFQSAFMHGVELAVTISFIAAASAVTSIPRLLRQLPAGFQSFATLIIIAVTFIPTVFDDMQRLERTQRWRGASGSWLRRLQHNIIALGDGALRRSVLLTSSMSTRGYQLETANSTFLFIALTCGALGIGFWTAIPTSSSIALLLLVAAGVFLGLHLQNARMAAQRTKFHHDPWNPLDYALITSASISALLASAAPLVSVALALLPIAVAPAPKSRVYA